MSEPRSGAQPSSRETHADPDGTRSLLGPLGVWANLDALPAPEALEFARAVDGLGFGALWINETTGREPFAMLGALARETDRITLGLGVAAIHARDAVAAHDGARTVAELSWGRFVMGLGVSHQASAERRGHGYGAPVPAMREYLDAYDAAPWTGPAVTDPPLVVAALGDRMLALAATRSTGAFPFLVTVDQVAHARQVLDETAEAAGHAQRPLLVVSQKAILGSGPGVRDAARSVVGNFLGRPNYRNSLQRGGFDAASIETVSDPLVAALVAMGTAAELKDRVAAMLAAGADHVAVIPLSTDGRQADPATLRALAP
jgi:probable F420-dependent oxidoreductase